jgi:hypothetical protein
MRFLVVVFFAGLLGLSAGCFHYQLGTEGKLTFSTLYIAPVKNDAGLPQAVALFSAQLREVFLRDSRVRLVATPEMADVTLEVSLARFNRGVTSAREDDGGLARKFDLTLSALCALRDNRTGHFLFGKRAVETTRQIFTTPGPATRESDQLQAEYNTMPLLAKSLAERIASGVLDVW